MHLYVPLYVQELTDHFVQAVFGWIVVKVKALPLCVCVQEPDYGSLYEGRNPGFYVEANQMPTFKVTPLSSCM